MITVTKPSVDNPKTEFDYKIEWVDSDEDSDAWISLYYDDNTNPDDGKTLIIDTIREDNAVDSYHWIISDDVGVGKYYVYAEISDEENTTYDYSDGPLELIPPSLRGPENIGIKNNLDKTGVKLETHDILPELTWSNSPLNPLPNASNLISYKYIVNIGTSATDKNDLLRNWETKSTSVKLANNLSYGEDYYFEVKVTDGRGHFSPGTGATFFIVNHPPSAPEITISPPKPTTESTLTVKIVNGSVDPDNDQVEYTYKWYKTDVEQDKYSGQTVVVPADTKKGDKWKVEVTPFDVVGGIQRSAGTTTYATIEIGNALPNPRIVAPQDGTKFQEGAEVVLIAEADDPDLDDNPNEVLKYRWESHLGGLLYEGDEATFKTTGLEVGVHLITLNVSNENVMDYNTDTIKIEVTKAKESPSTTKETDPIMYAIAGSAIIVVIIIIIIAMMFLMKGRRKEEPMYPELDETLIEEPTGPSAEELYGADEVPEVASPPAAEAPGMPAPGEEAGPVFGSSLEDAPTQQLPPAEEGPEAETPEPEEPDQEGEEAAPEEEKSE
jgi:hypothetical protein